MPNGFAYCMSMNELNECLKDKAIKRESSFSKIRVYYFNHEGIHLCQLYYVCAMHKDSLRFNVDLDCGIFKTGKYQTLVSVCQLTLTAQVSLLTDNPLIYTIILSCFNPSRSSKKIHILEKYFHRQFNPIIAPNLQLGC